MNPWLLTLPIAYLLGSIPFGYLLVRIFRKEDIRAIGSGNIGATNVARSGAKGLGIATLVLDALKGFVAVMFALHIAPGNLDLAAAAAVAAILGHVFPIWLGFKGGKGIATALGVFLALSWPTALCALVVFILVTLASRYVSLGSILGAVALPMFMLYFQPYRSPIFVGGTIFISLLCILKHSANIARLKSGTESKLGSKKSAESGHA
jgi:glycerol-3-phosphate acyltransferase PlsY